MLTTCPLPCRIDSHLNENHFVQKIYVPWHEQEMYASMIRINRITHQKLWAGGRRVLYLHKPFLPYANKPHAFHEDAHYKTGPWEQSSVIAKGLRRPSTITEQEAAKSLKEINAGAKPEGNKNWNLLKTPKTMDQTT